MTFGIASTVIDGHTVAFVCDILCKTSPAGAASRCAVAVVAVVIEHVDVDEDVVGCLSSSAQGREHEREAAGELAEVSWVEVCEFALVAVSPRLRAAQRPSSYWAPKLLRRFFNS